MLETRRETAKRLARASNHISSAIPIFDEDDTNMDLISLIVEQIIECVFA